MHTYTHTYILQYIQNVQKTEDSIIFPITHHVLQVRTNSGRSFRRVINPLEDRVRDFQLHLEKLVEPLDDRSVVLSLLGEEQSVLVSGEEEGRVCG